MAPEACCCAAASRAGENATASAALPVAADSHPPLPGTRSIVRRRSVQIAAGIAPSPSGSLGAFPRRKRLGLAGSLASTAALALLPKCPMCLVAYLSALGLGAGAASVAGALVPIAGVAAAVIACLLGVQLARRARRSRRIAPALAAAAALAGLAIAFLAGAPTVVRVTVLAALTFALIWADRDAAGTRQGRRPTHTAVA